MCGHVGYISKWKSGMMIRDVEAFEEMLYIDAIRGQDATGVAIVTKHQGVDVYKENSTSQFFLYDKEYREAKKSFTTKGRALLGHNRKSTVGGNTDAHAHPFVYDDRYVFFHNGTLINHHQISNTDVDSDALGGLLVRCNGEKEKLEEALGIVNGAYACVWYDSVLNTIYFLRNSERPLSISQLDNGDFIYSSEHWISAYPVLRRQAKIKDNYEVKPNSLYSLCLDTEVLTLMEVPLVKKSPPSPNTQVFRSPGVTDTDGINSYFSKRAAKKMAALLHKKNYISFTITDVVCNGGEECSSSIPYDWIVTGTNEEFPGVMFRSLLKDRFEYETLTLYNCLVYGSMGAVEHDSFTGALTTLVHQPTIATAKKQTYDCH